MKISANYKLQKHICYESLTRTKDNKAEPVTTIRHSTFESLKNPLAQRITENFTGYNKLIERQQHSKR